MINSRALCTLIRLNHVNKLATVIKTHPSYLRHSFKSLNSGFQINYNQVKIMSSQKNLDAELEAPERNIDYKKLIEKKQDKNVVLIDVREDSEIKETGKLPGSIHIPLGQLENALHTMDAEKFKKTYGADKPGKDQELIFSCKSGVRSKKALKISLELGYNKSASYSGGWLDWEKNNPKKA